MAIVTYKDFSGKNESLPVDEKVRDELNAYIDRFEPKILSELLGYELYKEFKAGIEAATPEQKWINLRDGADYRDSCDVLSLFDGLKVASVAHIYYKFTKENQEFASEVGIKRIASQNSEGADPSRKQSIAINLASEINEQCKGFIEWSNNETPDTYENYIYIKRERITHFNF